MVGNRPEALPLVLLVDEQTASAAEVLTAALQANSRAVVLGERTYGKAVAWQLGRDGGEPRPVGICHCYGPDGRDLQQGVEPDVILGAETDALEQAWAVATALTQPQAGAAK